MDEHTRDQILDSHERAMELAVKVGSGDTPTVQVGRSTLRLLLAEHAFVCGVALGLIDKENSRK